MCACISPNFQTAQFQSNILIHLISYMLHVVTLDLDKHGMTTQPFYNNTLKWLKVKPCKMCSLIQQSHVKASEEYQLSYQLSVSWYICLVRHRSVSCFCCLTW